METENEKVNSESVTETETDTSENSNDTEKTDTSITETTNSLTEEKVRELVKGMLGEFMDRFQNGAEPIADEKSTDNENEKDTPIDESELI